jgi:phosphoglycerate dehydrogenase-like enzyme
MDEAIAAAGGELTNRLEKADGLVWLDWANADLLPSPLPKSVRWVQLPSSGIEPWVDRLDDRRQWTSAAAAFARPVAEHALSLMLAGARRLHHFARSTTWARQPLEGLSGKTVAIIGAGAIGRSLTEMLQPLGCEILPVTRRGLDGTIPVTRVAEVWPRADYVVLAAPDTPQTRHLVGAEQLAAMRPNCWLVNVSRGTIVVTEALLEALDDDRIAGAALDVTDPEPLPDGHPLWSHPKVLITPHNANPESAMRQNLAHHVGENTARLAAGQPLLSLVQVDAGY